ncbi:type II secretion system F family protein [Methanocaldococcus infernus]
MKKNKNKEDKKNFIKELKKKIDIFLVYLGLKVPDRELLKELKEKKEEKFGIDEDLLLTTEESIDIEKYEDLLIHEPEDLLGKAAASISSALKRRKLITKYDLIILGYKDEIAYFKKVLMYVISIFLIFVFLGILDNNIIDGFFKGLIFSVILLAISPFYPRLKLIIFKGEIKLQILLGLLYMTSLLKAGASLPEILTGLARSREYGVLSYEAALIIRDINSGMTFEDALRRAIMRTTIPLLRKVFDQMIIGYNKGNLSLLLEKLYEEIVRESLSKLDTSKFMIQNLGNLAFGVGLIMPFSGLIMSAMISNQGFSGILNAVNFLMLNLGPILAIIFGVFVKMKVE